MKKSFLYASSAILYIVGLVSLLNLAAHALQDKPETILIPMTMLSLFVLSASIMGFLFLSEPLSLLIENKKHEAIVCFVQIVGFFACFVAVFVFLLFFSPIPFPQGF